MFLRKFTETFEESRVISRYNHNPCEYYIRKRSLLGKKNETH